MASTDNKKYFLDTNGVTLLCSAINKLLDTSCIIDTPSGKNQSTLNAEFATSVSSLSTQLSSLSGSIDETFDTISDNISSINTSISNLSSGLSTVTQNLNTTMASVSTLDSSLTSTMSTVNTLSRDLSTTMSTVSSLNNSLTSTISSVNSLSSGLSTVEQNLNTTMTSVSSLNNSLTSTISSVNALSGDLSTTKTAVSTLDTKLTTTMTSVGKLSGDLATVVQGLDATIVSVNALSGDLSTTIASVGKLSGDLTTTKTAVSTLDTNLTTTNTTVGKLNGSLTTIAQGLDTISSTVSSLSNKLTSTIASVSTLSSGLTTLDSTVSSLSNKLTSTISSISTITSYLESTMASVSTLSSGLSTTNSTVSSLSSRLNNLSSTVSSHKSAFDNNISTLSNELEHTFNTKTGDVFYDIDNQYLYFFKSAKEKNKWIQEGRLINSKDVMYRYKLSPDIYTTAEESEVNLLDLSGGVLASIPSATPTSAGVMTKDDKIKLNELDKKQNKMRIKYIDVSYTTSPITIDHNNIVKIIGDLVSGKSTLNIKFANNPEIGALVQYGLHFSSTVAATLILPSNIKWANNKPIVIEPGLEYELLFTTDDGGVNYTATYANYIKTDTDNNAGSKPYFTVDVLTAAADGTSQICIARRGFDGSVPAGEKPYYYSKYTNGTWSNWVQWSAGNYINVVKGDKIRFKCGDSTTGGNTAQGSVSGSTWVPTGFYQLWIAKNRSGDQSKTPSCTVKVSGYMTSLYFGDDFMKESCMDSLPAGTFARFFSHPEDNNGMGGCKDNYNIVDAGDLILPTKRPQLAAYFRMFMNCKGLTKMPQILAEKALGHFVCKDMFAYCTSLVEATDLHFTSFDASDTGVGFTGTCAGMFFGCENLIKPPKLPATWVSSSTYYQMFRDCTSLEYTPDIPVTEIRASSSFAQMFYGCTNLKKASCLRTKKLAGACYSSMFYGCENLKVAPDIQAETGAYAACYRMFYDCKSLTVPPPKVLNVLYNPEALNASQDVYYNAHIWHRDVSNSVCYEMFYGCTNLLYAPLLPAKEPTKNCYYQMFYGCTNLKYVPCFGISKLWQPLASETDDPSVSGYQACYRMFYNCTSLTEFEFNKRMDISDITDFTYLPIQAGGLFGRMFDNCSSLSKIKIYYDNIDNKDTANNHSNNALAYNLFGNGIARQGVSSAGTLTVSKKWKDTVNNWDGILGLIKPSGWVCVVDDDF